MEWRARGGGRKHLIHFTIHCFYMISLKNEQVNMTRKCNIYLAFDEKNQIFRFVNNKDADQPVHPSSMINTLDFFLVSQGNICIQQNLH